MEAVRAPGARLHLRDAECEGRLRSGPGAEADRERHHRALQRLPQIESAAPGLATHYLPTTCGASVLFSRQTKSSSSVSGARYSLSVTVNGAVYALGSSIVTSVCIRP